MDKCRKLLGPFSALGTFGVLALIAWKTGALEIVMNELPIFLLGGFHEITAPHTTFLKMVSVILAVVVVDFPCAVGLAYLQAKILGESGEHEVTESLKKMKVGHHFFISFVFIFLEELFARWFFLGVLTKITFLSGPIAFYLLFLIGNGIWALMHLGNFKKREDRHVLRILPIFSGGFFLTYVFLKYGLFAAVLAHFALDAILFAFHKTQDVNAVDCLIVGYGALCMIVSYVFMEKSLADILPWFANNPIFRLPGWGFWDYVKFSVFLSGSLIVVFGLLLYDREGAGKGRSGGNAGVMTYVIGTPIFIGLLYGTYALMGLFISNVPYRVLGVATFLAFIRKGASGSAMARTFWSGLADGYVTVCILQALGFWSVLGLIAIETIIYAPKTILNTIDK